MRKEKVYSGPERRIRPINDRRCELNCFEHSGLVEKVASIERKADSLESEKFLSTASYWWTTGILLSILVSVLSATLYTTFQAGEALRSVKEAQIALSVQLNFLQQDIDDLKRKSP